VKRVRGDGGESLIELLVALSIMGTAITVLLAGLGTAISMSAIHRKQATAGASSRAFAEAIENAVAKYPSEYDTTCTGTATYATKYSPPANYAATVTEVRYLSGTAWSATCGADQGVQRVMLRIASADGKVVVTLAVILRKPCRSQDDYPLDWPCL
jgi:type II secretory pathway pseudopilin PulG